MLADTEARWIRGEPVEPRHHQYVTGFEPADRLGQLWPIGPSARSFLLEDIAAARRL
jgi:hypothetical protein